MQVLSGIGLQELSSQLQFTMSMKAKTRQAFQYSMRDAIKISEKEDKLISGQSTFDCRRDFRANRPTLRQLI